MLILRVMGEYHVIKRTHTQKDNTCTHTHPSDPCRALSSPHPPMATSPESLRLLFSAHCSFERTNNLVCGSVIQREEGWQGRGDTLRHEREDQQEIHLKCNNLLLIFFFKPGLIRNNSQEVLRLVLWTHSLTPNPPGHMPFIKKLVKVVQQAN